MVGQWLPSVPCNQFVVTKNRNKTKNTSEGSVIIMWDHCVAMQAFRSGDYLEALSYYSRSLQLHSTTATHNNRAITFLKLERYQEAVQDCDIVLQLEPDNTKGLLSLTTSVVLCV